MIIMAKQRQKKIAWKLLTYYLDTKAPKPTKTYIYSFVDDYCQGLNEIDKIKDHKIRFRVRLAWRNEIIRKAEEYCSSHLSEGYYTRLLNTLTAFYRDKTRIDGK